MELLLLYLLRKPLGSFCMCFCAAWLILVLAYGAWFITGAVLTWLLNNLPY